MDSKRVLVTSSTWDEPETGACAAADRIGLDCSDCCIVPLK